MAARYNTSEKREAKSIVRDVLRKDADLMAGSSQRAKSCDVVPTEKQIEKRKRHLQILLSGGKKESLRTRMWIGFPMFTMDPSATWTRHSVSSAHTCGSSMMLLFSLVDVLL